MKAYYDRRASEYDEWYLGLGRFDKLERPHWSDDLRGLEWTVVALPPARTLDVACGTGFLTRHLRGEIVGLDQSASETSFEERQERVRNDGSRWTVYKRYFTGEQLARELGRAEVQHESRWFVVVRSTE